MSAWRASVFRMGDAESIIQVEKVDQSHICFALKKVGEVAHVELVEDFA